MGRRWPLGNLRLTVSIIAPAHDLLLRGERAAARSTRHDLRVRAGRRVVGHLVLAAVSPALERAVGVDTARVVLAAAQVDERARGGSRLVVVVLAPASECAVRLDAAGVEEARAHSIELHARRRVALAVLVRAPALHVVARGD